MRNTDFIDNANARSRMARDICVKCEGVNDTGYTHCKSCAEKIVHCEFEGCITAPSETVINFSKSTYSKILCFNHQPGQIRVKELARKEGI